MRAKKKADYKKVLWASSIEEFLSEISKPCYYCGNKLCSPSEVGIGLDQIIAGHGYTVANVYSCCYTCNRIKGDDLSSEETKVAVNAIITLRESGGKS